MCLIISQRFLKSDCISSLKTERKICTDFDFLRSKLLKGIKGEIIIELTMLKEFNYVHFIQANFLLIFA